MAKLPNKGAIIPTTADRVHDLYAMRAAESIEVRGHLGCSILGQECHRKTWLTFRWAASPAFGGRMERLFERGKREELWLIEDLRALGLNVLEIDPETGKQWRVKWGHVGGSVDAVVDGLSERPGWHVLEIKTSNVKQFERLLKSGNVRRAKPEHWAQMQLYMHGLTIGQALYMSVCKDDDRIYSELVNYDETEATKLVALGQMIALSDVPPAKKDDKNQPPCLYTSKDGKTYPCAYRELCWGKSVPAVSCRSCIASTPDEGGSWSCAKDSKGLSVEEQLIGCGDHILSPSAVNASIACVTKTSITYQFDDGSRVRSGKD
jgi:hypothetical protein